MPDEAWLRALDTTIDRVLKTGGMTRAEQDEAIREAVRHLHVD